MLEIIFPPFFNCENFIMVLKNNQKRNSNRRKIIGKENSRIMHLPIFWLNSVGLDAGDYVEITIGPELELIVTPEHKNNLEIENDFQE